MKYFPCRFSLPTYWPVWLFVFALPRYNQELFAEARWWFRAGLRYRVTGPSGCLCSYTPSFVTTMNSLQRHAGGSRAGLHYRVTGPSGCLCSYTFVTTTNSLQRHDDGSGLVYFTEILARLTACAGTPSFVTTMNSLQKDDDGSGTVYIARYWPVWLFVFALPHYNHGLFAEAR